MESGILREWRKKIGEAVKRGDIIADVETQKGLIEIEVFDEGTVHELLVQEGAKVPVGTLMARILVPGERAPVELVGAPVITLAPRGVKASPLARRIAAEHGITLASLMGSGPDGVITREDVEKAFRAHDGKVGLASPEGTTVVPPPDEGMRHAVAAAMSRSNREIPHYYLGTTIDMARAMAWLDAENTRRPVERRLLPVVLLLKAVARALHEVPELNAYWEDTVVRKDGIHLGFVVSLRTGGIVVPAIHDVDRRGLDDLMGALSDLVTRARAFKLRSSELGDGTFTVTSLGDLGVESVFGVIYPPQVGLAAFGSISDKPVAMNGRVEVHPVITATLAADHRATDGVIGGHFLRVVNQQLQHPAAL